jgi:hypothetical protein
MPVRYVVNLSGCASYQWLAMTLGHFLFRLQENGIVSCPMVSVSFVEHAVERPVLHSTPTTASISIVASSLALVFYGITCSILTFCPWRSEVLLPIL